MVRDTSAMEEAGRRPHVVIVGAGFGGLAAAKALADRPVDITIVDRQNHHLFQPLLYQVATAALNPSNIAQPVRHILAKQVNCRALLAEVRNVDVAERRVETSLGPIDYDYLVLATGATHAYFGNDHWAPHAPGLKTIDDALEIRRRILLAFEAAESLPDDATDDRDDIAERERLMTFVVVGAGPTGVEMAGAIREIATESLRRDFRRIDTADCRVLLIEAGPSVLPPFPVKLQRSAERQLTALGVDVRTATRVTDITAEGVTTTAGFIPSATVVWAAGVAASPLAALVATDTDRSGRVVVGHDLTLPGHPDVFVIGDMAAAVDAAGTAVPGVAPAAEQGGEHAAACVVADFEARPRPSFRYRDKGSMATIGRSKAVANLGPRLQFGGRLAWLLWGAVHVWSLVEFRSRLRTMSNWNWQYFTGHRGARLITGVDRSPQ